MASSVSLKGFLFASRGLWKNPVPEAARLAAGAAVCGEIGAAGRDGRAGVPARSRPVLTCPPEGRTFQCPGCPVPQTAGSFAQPALLIASRQFCKTPEGNPCEAATHACRWKEKCRLPDRMRPGRLTCLRSKGRCSPLAAARESVWSSLCMFCLACCGQQQRALNETGPLM